MPSIRDDINKITAQVVELDKKVRSASQNTKNLGDRLKFDGNNIYLIQIRFF